MLGSAVAAATLATEAVSPSAAVFFATHAPLRIYRSLADGRHPDTPGAPVDEEEVRRDFLTRPTSQRHLAHARHRPVRNRKVTSGPLDQGEDPLH